MKHKIKELLTDAWNENISISDCTDNLLKLLSEFENCSELCMMCINNNYHIHTKIIIENDKAEVVEGIKTHLTKVYIHD